MLFYLIPYLIVLPGSYLLFKLGGLRSYGWLLFLLIFPAVLIVILRGNVGTDTKTYLDYFHNLINNIESDQQYEPGFTLLAKIMVALGLSARVCIIIISLLTIIFLTISFGGSKDEAIIFCLLIFPIFFFDMTMNGLRYGLGFSLSALAIGQLYKNKIVYFIILGLLAVTMQYSCFIMLGFFLILKIKKPFIMFMGIGLGLISFLLILSTGYLYSKQEAYKDLMAPHGSSGLGPLILFLLIFFAYLFYSKAGKSIRLLLVILVLELASFMLARITYAGLRLETLFLFTLIIFLKEEHNFIRRRNGYFISLMFIGLLGFGFLMKNFSEKVEGVESPFIPYKFLWTANS